MGKNSLRASPVFWSMFIFVIALAITFAVITREDSFLKQNNIYIPSQPPQIVTVWPQPSTSLPTGQVIPATPVYSSLGPILIYFFSVVIVLGVILFLVPLSWLKFILKGLFALLFCWGIFILLVMWLPVTAAIAIAVLVGLVWFFVPRIWLHNISLMLALTAVAAVFGRFLSPWTSMILLGVLAIYDFLAVRLGYMLWMAKKMSDTNALPAFVIPRSLKDWNLNLNRAGVAGITEQKPADRLYSILGGGDIGFPLLLVASVYFAQGLEHSIIVAAFTLAGLASAYWVQKVFFKGKPTPAIPPIAVVSVVGLLIVSFIL